MQTTPEDRPNASGQLFPATVWSAVIEAREGETTVAARALEQLARAYWRPLYIFVRQRGRDHEGAAEDVQGFFAHLISHDFLRFVQPREGRFRTFLLASFTRWLDDQRDRAHAAKRGGGRALIPLEELNSVHGAVVQEEGAPEEAFDRRWAREVFDAAVGRLSDRWSERMELFLALRRFVDRRPGGVCQHWSAAWNDGRGGQEGGVRSARPVRLHHSRRSSPDRAR